MASRILAPVQFLLTSLVSACCLPFSETSFNEPEPSWNAAFNEKIPDNLIVTHGQYWRSAHWSAEYSWFFALEPNEAFFQEFVEYNRMEELRDAHSVDDLVMEMIFTPPEWFAPAGPSYQVWRSNELFLLRDPEQGTLFLHSGIL